MNFFGIGLLIISFSVLALGDYFQWIPAHLLRNPIYQLLVALFLIYELHQDGWWGLFPTLTSVLLSVAYLLVFLKGYRSHLKHK